MSFTTGWITWLAIFRALLSGLCMVYTALFAPVTQAICVSANTPRHDIDPTKIVKGLTTAVTALPICIHCWVRHADSLKW